MDSSTIISLNKFVKINKWNFQRDNNKNSNNYNNPIICLGRESTRLNDILIKKKICLGHRVPKLVGSHGIFATQEIPKDPIECYEQPH